MDLHLQFGYGMMDHSRALLDTWGGGTVILSPRDLDTGQLTRLAQDILRNERGRVLLDPQFYLPDADHGRLTAHDYWPDTYSSGSFWGGDELRTLLAKLAVRNRELGCFAMILPGIYADRVDDDWLERQSLVIEESRAATPLPRLVTVALGADAIRSTDDIDEVLAAATTWDAHGIYLVCEHPRGDYLVSDPTWMANVLDLVAGLRLKGKSVTVGYCNQQMLILACAGASAIASGTWMNVRSFPPHKFRAQYDDEIKQRTTWYYCAQALSEYKIPFLDIAHRQGILADMQPEASLGSRHANVLFAGPQPSSVRWSEQTAFRHYLQCIWSQAVAARKPSFNETVAAHERMLDDAETLLVRLRAAGVRGQMRDFADCIDVGRAALSLLVSSRGAILRRSWDAL